MYFYAVYHVFQSESNTPMRHERDTFLAYYTPY